MFGFFERLLHATEPPGRPEPPARLIAFYWHFAREAKPLFIALFGAGLVLALLELADPGLHRPHRCADHRQSAGRVV